MSIMTAISLGKVSLDFFNAFSGAKKSFKYDSEMANHLKNLNVVYEALVSANEKNSSLVNRITQLESEIKHLKGLSVDKERYSKKEVATGVFAYVPEGFSGDFKNAEKYCTTCFENNQKSQLIFSTHRHKQILKCPNHIKSPIYFKPNDWLKSN